MAFNYNPNNATELDLVRFKLDDVVESQDSIPDETIEAELTRTGSVTKAILSCGQVLYIKLLKQARELELRDQRRRYGERARDLKALLDDWAETGVPGIVEETAGGMAAGFIQQPDMRDYERFL